MESYVIKHAQVKYNFWSQMLINITGSPLYEEVLGIICHSLLYFAILTCVDEL